jgi:hypothetical protein
MNDMQTDRKARDRDSTAPRRAWGTAQRAMLVGTLAVLLGNPDPLRAEDKRFIRTTPAPELAQYSGGVVPGLPNAYAYPEQMPQSYGGWQDGLGADCGMGCPPTWRTRAEVLMLNREGEAGATASAAFSLGDFDYTEGGRITVDRKYDCSLGWEIVYTGLFDFEEEGTRAGAGTLDSLFQTTTVNVSAFNGANLHQQLYRSRLQSVEFSEKWWGWDVFTTMVGVRYVNVEEDFFFGSIDANNDIGVFSIETDNHMFGPQLGIEMLYPLGRWSFDSMLKGALFANVGESNVFLSNAGIVQFDNFVEDVEFGALIEYGMYMRYSLTERVSVRAGYEILWVYGPGLVTEQASNPIHGATGASFVGQGDVFYHGGTLGVEIVW